MPVADIFLESVVKRLADYKKLSDKTFAQLSEEDFHFVAAEESNSIAVIIQHMHGNMMSRWTDFLTSDGEKEWRKRDTEFILDNDSRASLMQSWEEGWQILFHALTPLQVADFDKKIVIRGEPHTIVQAINRQLTHYGYHI